METLTPVQRVAVIAIGLALTLLVAMFLLPWAWKQISEWLPAAETEGLGLAPACLRVECAAPMTLVSVGVRPAVTMALPGALPGRS